MNQKEKFKQELASWTVEEVAAEYNLICSKRSKLNKLQRELVVYMTEELIKMKKLSYKVNKPVKKLEIDIICNNCKKGFKTTDYKAGLCDRCKTKT